MDAQKEDNPTKLEIEYTEVQLQQIIQYFVNGYKPLEGTITSHESFVDVVKGKVVLKLYIEKLVEDSEQS